MRDAILLPAAGASSRMRGRDKLMEQVNDRPLLRLQAERARAACPRVFVALPPRPHPRYGALKGLDVTTLAVPEHAEGLGGTLRGAVTQLPQDIDRLLLLLPDLPDITEVDIRSVLAAANAHPEGLVWRGATAEGQPGHPVIFDRSLLPAFADLSGDTGGAPVIASVSDRVFVHKLTGDQALDDLDTPEQWADWRSRTKSTDD